MTASTENGFPSSADFFTTGSESTVKSFISTPPGFNTVTHSAAVHMHQGPSETTPIGVPGSTYAPNKADNIFRTQGGHLLIFGNAPGHETIRLQSKSGAAIELSEDASIRIVTGKGLHMAIGGDNHLVISGDLAITTTGNMKFKAGAVYFDVGDFVVNASGSHMTNVHNDHNLFVVGDSHTIINTDRSETIGGSELKTVGGFSSEQIVGNKTIQATGSVSILSTGNQVFNTQGTFSMSAKGSATFGTQASFGIKATGATTLDTNSTYNVNAGSNININGQTVNVNQSAANPSTNITITAPVVPSAKDVLNQTGDLLATNGSLPKIIHADQIVSLFLDDYEGNIPSNVLSKADQLGVFSDYQTPGKATS